MKSTLKFLSSTALLALTSSLLLTGCPAEETCTLDADCDTGYTCNADENVCELSGDVCVTSADCTTDGQECISNVNNDGTFVCGAPVTCADLAVDADKATYCGGLNAGDLCLPAASGDAGVSECRAATDCGEFSGDADGINAFCRAAAGETGEESYSCNVDGDAPVCESDVVTNHYQVIIKDLSTEDCDLAEDDNGFDPGSDITFVHLQDAAMMTLGWGQTVTYSPGETQNDFKVETVLDGAAPDLIATGEQEDIDNQCPVGDSAGRFSTTSVLTLGCTGSVIVDFPSGSDAQPIYNGQIVTVGEYAPVCNQSTGGSVTGTTDLYDVYVCPVVAVGAAAPTDTDCIADGVKISTTDVAGLKISTVAGAKDAPAI